MCVAYFAWRVHPAYPLIIISNRDEAYRRASAPMRSWPESDIVAGVDEAGGGTWFGVTAGGRFALLVNHAGGPPRVNPSHAIATGETTRGRIAVDFLESTATVAEFSRRLTEEAETYRAFNLLIGDQNAIEWVTNSPVPRSQTVNPGVHGLAASGLDSRWPKVADGIAELNSLIDRDVGGTTSVREDYFDVLGDRRHRWYRSGALRPSIIRYVFSPRFIRLGVYGTRSSTLAQFDPHGGIELEERRFGRRGQATGTTQFVL